MNLIYITNLSKPMMPQLKTRPYSLPHIHLLSARHPDSQNFYLYCASIASAGLATSARGSIDKDALALVLAKAMNMRNNQKMILAQRVEWLKE
jgi:hypothetical protein